MRWRFKRADGPVRGAAILFLASAIGCLRLVSLERPHPAPSGAELVQIVTARQASIRSLNARARATSWLGGDRVRATVLMLADRDGRLRFEAEVSLQGTVAILAAIGGEFVFLDVRAGVLRRGPACPENVASLIRIPFAPRDVAAILMGDVPGVPETLAAAPAAPCTAADPCDVTWDAAAGTDVLAWRGIRIAFRQDKGRVRIVAVQSSTAAAPAWQVAYDDFETVDGVDLPRGIRFAEGGQSFDDGVEVKIKDRAINLPVPDAAFRITPPAGVATVEIGCGSRR